MITCITYFFFIVMHGQSYRIDLVIFIQQTECIEKYSNYFLTVDLSNYQLFQRLKLLSESLVIIKFAEFFLPQILLYLTPVFSK